MRRFLFTIDQEPQSKNMKVADAVAFQNALVTTMSESKQCAYRGPVFLQLDFYTTSKTPTSIYNLPKNYLDLLEKPREDSGIDRKYLLYRDDRQVKALIVRQHFKDKGGQPEIWVQAEPFRDFNADVELINCISRDDFLDDNNRRVSIEEDFRGGPFSNEQSTEVDQTKSLVEFERNKEIWLRRMSNDDYELYRQMM